MKTLFLDFDGVLHCMSQVTSKPFDRVPLLEPLVDVAPFKIVISSSWRFHIELNEIGHRLGRLGSLIAGTTGEAVVGRHARHREILEYVSKNKIIDWRALDDSYLEFPESADGLILCDPRIGVSAKEVNELQRWLLTDTP